MYTQTQSIEAPGEFLCNVSSSLLPANGPAQILIIDKANGPADRVFDVFGRLFEFGVTLTLANNREDVLIALKCYKIDLLAIGLENHNLETLALVSSIRKDYPNLTIIGIGNELSPFQRTQCQLFGLENIWTMPQRARELKALLRTLIQHYLME